MKVHVTKSYAPLNNPNNRPSTDSIDLLQRHGILEMGIPDCTEDSFSENELSKLLDGIIASVGCDDTVILVLPTGNGSEFEDRLIRKITIYSGKAPYIIWMDSNYHDLYKETFSSNIPGEYVCSGPIGDLKLLQIILNFITEGNCGDDSLDLASDEFVHIEFKLSGDDSLYLSKVYIALESIVEHTDDRIFFHVKHDVPLTDKVTDTLNAIINRGMHKLDFTVTGTDELKNVKELWEADLSYYGLENVLYKINDFPGSLQSNDDSAHEFNGILTRVSETANLSASIETNIIKKLTECKDNLVKSISDLQRDGESSHE